MSADTPGFSRVSTAHLTRLLRALHRDVLPSPVTRSALIEKGFGDFERDIDAVVGLDKRAAQAVVVSVLKERGAGVSANAALVYKGLPAAGTRSRDAIEVVRELIATAAHTLTAFGVAADAADGALLSTLSAAIQGRGLRVKLAFDVADDSASDDAARARLAPLGAEFFTLHGARARGVALLVDGKKLYVSSAPLSATEEDTFIDFGAIIEDRDAVRAFEDEWARLITNGRLVPR